MHECFNGESLATAAYINHANEGHVAFLSYAIIDGLTDDMPPRPSVEGFPFHDGLDLFDKPLIYHFPIPSCRIVEINYA